jgi:small GTP-binding protein
VGDSYVGKTCLIFNYAKDEFLTKPVSTVADEYDLSDIQYMGTKVKLSVWDLSGKDEHKSLREFAYGKADAVFFCFSLAQIALEGQEEGKIQAGSTNSATLSLMSIKNKWIPEIRKSSVKILVGTKSDQLFVG